MISSKDKLFLAVSNCICRLNREERRTLKYLKDLCNKYSDSFRDNGKIPNHKSLKISESDLTRVKKYQDKASHEASHVSSHKWQLIYYVLKEERLLHDEDAIGTLEHDMLYHYLIQHLHNGDYSENNNIQLLTGPYLLKRYSYLEKGKISVSKLEIRKTALPGKLDNHYLTYEETKKVAHGGQDIRIAARGYVVKSLNNYLLIGTANFSQVDPGSRIEPHQDHFFDFMILKPTTFRNFLSGITAGIIREDFVPFATRVFLEHVDDMDVTDIDANLGIREPNESEYRQIENDISDDSWKVLLQRKHDSL